MERGCWPQQDDGWDEVWDAYEARIASRPAAPVAPSAPPPPATARRRSASVGVVALAVFGLGYLAGSAWPVLSFCARMARQDTASVLGGLDATPAREALRQGLRAHAGLPAGAVDSGADRMLAAMADAMAEDLTAPDALRRLVAVRGVPADARTGGVRDPAAGPLPRMRPGLAGGMALTLAPERGEGGLRLRLRYRAGGWQAYGITVLEPGAQPGSVLLSGPGAGSARRV